MSRNGNTSKSFPELTAAIGPALRCRSAVLDGEIVLSGVTASPTSSRSCTAAGRSTSTPFDLLWLDGRDLRGLLLLERKRLLRDLVPHGPCPVLYVDHVAERGVDLFRAVCAQDLEGIVAKQTRGLYTPDATSWVKIKNRNYTQMVGRWEWFARRRAMGHEQVLANSVAEQSKSFYLAVMRSPTRNGLTHRLSMILESIPLTPWWWIARRRDGNRKELVMHVRLYY